MDRDAREVRQAFGGPWGRTWSLLSDVNLATDLRLRRRFARRMELAGGERVLDLGCGAGNWGRVLVRLARGLRLVHLDLSPAMLLTARRRIPSRPEQRHLFAAADGCRLPLAPGTVDRVVCGNVLGLQSESAPLLAECARVLRPRGRVVIVDFFEDTPLQRAASRTLKLAVGRLVPSSRRMIARHRRMRSADLEPLLAGCGFGEIVADVCFGANGMVTAVRE